MNEDAGSSDRHKLAGIVNPQMLATTVKASRNTSESEIRGGSFFFKTLFQAPRTFDVLSLLLPPAVAFQLLLVLIEHREILTALRTAFSNPTVRAAEVDFPVDHQDRRPR